jgi:preprotein translocase subunit SecB
MAKKKTTNKPKADLGTRAPVRSTLTDLAWPVAQVVNLRQILVEDLHAERSSVTSTKVEGGTVSQNIDSVEFGRHVTEERLVVGIRFVLEAAKKEEADTITKISCKFILLYDVPGIKGFPDDALAAFAQTTGVFNVWPYWRELVHSMSLRMAIPPVVLPSYRIGSKTSSAEKDKKPQ